MSPIEEQFQAAMLRHWICGDAAEISEGGTLKAISEEHCIAFVMIPQSPVGPYRADFGLMLIRGSEQKMLAVELDGHDFHEKTKKQAAHDKKRDRYFAADGLTVVRFTGSEVHRDADACADEAIQLLSRQPVRAV